MQALDERIAIKKEKIKKMGVAVEIESDSDDSVIHVPYVKPKPPVVCLDDESDDESRADRSRSTVTQVDEDDDVESAQIVIESAISPSTEPVVVVEVAEEEPARKKKKKKNREERQKSPARAPEKEKAGKKKKTKNNSNNTPSASGDSTEPASASDGQASKNKDKTKKKKKKRGAESGNDPQPDDPVPNGLDHEPSSSAVSDISESTNAAPTPSRSGQPGNGTNRNNTKNNNKKRKADSGQSQVGDLPQQPSTRKRRRNGKEYLPGEFEDQVLGHAPPVGPKKRRKAAAARAAAAAKTVAVVDVPSGTDEVTEVSSSSRPALESSSSAERTQSEPPALLYDKNLTPADIDHYNFLKTLNLTGNIGFDENDLLNMALSPADFRRRNPLKNPLAKRRTTSKAAGKSTQVRVESNKGIDLNSSASSEAQSLVAAATATTTDEPQDVILTTPAGSTTPSRKQANATSVSSPQKAPPPPPSPISSGFVSVVQEKSQGKSKKKDASKAPPPQSAAPATAPAPAVPAPEKEKTLPVTTRPASDDEEEDRIGHFTAEELNQVRSHLQLNVVGVQTGPSPKPNSVLQAELVGGKSQQQFGVEKGTKAKAVRYFNVPPSAGLLVPPGREGSSSSSGADPEKSKKRKNRDSEPERNERKKRKADQQRDVSSNKRANDVRVSTSSSTNAAGRSAVRDVNSERLMNERPYPSTWTPSMIKFYGIVNVKVPEVDEVQASQSDTPRLWRAPVEREPRRKIRGRRFKCDNCGDFGDHVASRCPQPRREPTCIMCGETGHKTRCMYPDNDHLSRSNQHSRRSVPTPCGSAQCLNCGSKGSQRQGSGSYKQGEFMQFCNGCSKQHPKQRLPKCAVCCSSHQTTECPDSWRRYYSTTVDVEPDKLKEMITAGTGELQKAVYRSQTDSYCCNCGRKGHNFLQCNANRNYNSSYVPQNPAIVAELPQALTELQEGPSSGPSSSKQTDPVSSGDEIAIIEEDPPSTTSQAGGSAPVVLPRNSEKTIPVSTATATTVQEPQPAQSRQGVHVPTGTAETYRFLFPDPPCPGTTGSDKEKRKDIGKKRTNASSATATPVNPSVPVEAPSASAEKGDKVSEASAPVAPVSNIPSPTTITILDEDDDIQIIEIITEKSVPKSTPTPGPSTNTLEKPNEKESESREGTVETSNATTATNSSKSTAPETSNNDNPITSGNQTYASVTFASAAGQKSQPSSSQSKGPPPTQRDISRPGTSSEPLGRKNPAPEVTNRHRQDHHSRSDSRGAPRDRDRSPERLRGIRAAIDRRPSTDHNNSKGKGKKSVSQGVTTRCRDFPDCTNYSPNSKQCLKLYLKDRGLHIKVLKADVDFQLVKRLKLMFSSNDLSISLLKKRYEIHIAGEKSYLARDKILRIMSDLHGQSVKDVLKLLPPLGDNSPKEDRRPPSHARGGSSKAGGPGPTSRASSEKEKTAKAPVPKKAAASSSSATSDKPPAQVVTFDPKSIINNPSAVEELLISSPPSVVIAPPDSVPSNPPAAPAPDKAKNPPAVSGYTFERRLRQLVCQVPLKVSTATSGEAEQVPQTEEGTATATTTAAITASRSKLSPIKAPPPSTSKLSPIKAPTSIEDSSSSSRNRAPSPKRSRFSDNNNSRDRDYPQDQARDSRFDNQRNNNFSNFNNNEFYNNNPRNNFNPNYSHGPSSGGYHAWDEYMNRGPPPPGHDFDERNLPFDQRMQLNPLFIPNSPFSFRPPWNGNNNNSGYDPNASYGPPYQYPPQFNDYTDFTHNDFYNNGPEFYQHENFNDQVPPNNFYNNNNNPNNNNNNADYPREDDPAPPSPQQFSRRTNSRSPHRSPHRGRGRGNYRRPKRSPHFRRK